MNGILSKIFIFVTGAAIGSLVTWKVLKTRYEQIAEEEIRSMREYYQSKSKKNKTDKNNTESNDAEVEAYNEMARNYSTAASDSTDEKKEGVNMNKPRVITPDEFGEDPDYEVITLTYYSDGVLTDEMDEPINNINEIVGEESLTTFGEYENDSVFVRNEALKRDFEILRDSRPYSGR